MNAHTSIAVSDDPEFDALPEPEAWLSYFRDTLADTPARRWYDAEWKTGRASICRLLGIADEDRIYASYPFRTMLDDEGRPWIAAAIGCPSPYALHTAPWLDVADVLLWEPRTGRCHVAGDEKGSNLIAPAVQPDRLTVYTDARAFFRDWAAARARTGRLISKYARGEFAHEVHEPRDGGLPGALVIGDIERVPLAKLSAATLITGPGLTRRTLHNAIVKAAHLPRIEEGSVARG